MRLKEDAHRAQSALCAERAERGGLSVDERWRHFAMLGVMDRGTSGQHRHQTWKAIGHGVERTRGAYVSAAVHHPKAADRAGEVRRRRELFELHAVTLPRRS